MAERKHTNLINGKQKLLTIHAQRLDHGVVEILRAIADFESEMGNWSKSVIVPRTDGMVVYGQ